ncbi:hypothetical protein IF188_07655 [Microbacterium sp. NEAU-LLC]|uniref:Uncharacterized protein n=1 Tax=Microbacterium helvum TaxID=2773713 RepID=A0ABR8NLL8_9MICO|nr:hypothetical protein [Microbacterium helvum]MBD3941569.1 hypothetical protein [Microbacterium helvum]
MSTRLAPQRSSGEPDSLRLPSPDRVSIVDRVAMHLAVRLLLWSTRAPRLADDRGRHADAYRRQEDAAERERAYLRGIILAHGL